VQNIALTWEQAGVLAGCLYGTAFAASRVERASIRRLWPFVREAGTIAALFALWQLVGTVSVFGTQGAYARGRWIVRFQDSVHLPRESDVQSWVLPHPWLAQACNLYYASLHFFVLFALLLWMFLRHRELYGRARSSVIAITACCLLIQFLPVAPPRLVPQARVVDVAELYGQSVYSSGGAGVDQLAAMPSVHVAWALLVAVVVVRSSPSRWRWVAVGYPVLTVFVVVATGNHFWLDGIVAAALLALCEVALSAGRRWAADRALSRDRATVNVLFPV
jgi:hypothetical protein